MSKRRDASIRMRSGAETTDFDELSPDASLLKVPPLDLEFPRPLHNQSVKAVKRAAAMHGSLSSHSAAVHTPTNDLNHLRHRRSGAKAPLDYPRG